MIIWLRMADMSADDRDRIYAAPRPEIDDFVFESTGVGLAQLEYVCLAGNAESTDFVAVAGFDHFEACCLKHRIKFAHAQQADVRRFANELHRADHRADVPFARKRWRFRNQQPAFGQRIVKAGNNGFQIWNKVEEVERQKDIRALWYLCHVRHFERQTVNRDLRVFLVGDGDHAG